MYAYSATEAGNVPWEHPKRAVLSEPIPALLEAVEDKQVIINAIFSGIQPTSWSDSLANIMEIRARAIAELLEHTLPEIRDLATRKLESVAHVLRQELEWEAAEHSRRE